MSLFGAFIGASTDRLDRRTAMILITAVSLMTSASLFALAHFGLLHVWHLGLASFIAGIG
jgi:hypothetical protein